MKRKLFKKVLVYTLCTYMVFTTAPIFAQDSSSTVSKDTGNTEGGGKLVSQSWETINFTEGQILDISKYDINANRTIVIPSSISNLTIKGESSKIYEGLIIQSTSTIKLTIQNLNINNGYIDIAKTPEDNYLLLKGTNNIVGKPDFAAIVVQGADNKLIIGDADGTGRLKAQGGSYSAGIGGSKQQGDGHIVIQGGNISAIGGISAPGIGSGYQRAIKTIIIKGNAVIERSEGGSAGGAGIGGCADGSTIEKIEILDQANIKLAKGSAGAAGIGEGKNSGLKSIKIEGKNDKLTVVIEQSIGGEGAAGIGGGDANKENLKISIKNAIIKNATGGTNAAGIGGGCQRGADILIGDGAIIEKAIGGSGGAGIGSGPLGESKTITIEGKSLIKLAQGGNNGAGIGGGDTRSAIINITGGNIELAKGGANAAGIGFGAGNNDSKSITISGGVIYAEGGSGLNTNDIGAANYYDGTGGKTQQDAKNVKVSITGGTVMLGNNRVIGKDTSTHVNYMVVGYETYDTIKLNVSSNKKIYWRTKDNPNTNGELTKYSDERTVFILENQVDKIKNRDYWFVIVENEGLASEKSYIGLLAETDPTNWKTTYYNDSNVIVSQADSTYSVKEIPIQYNELTKANPVAQTIVPSGIGNKIVPYSVSNIGYSINFADMKTADPDIKDFVKVVGEIEIVPDDAPGKKDAKVEFLTSKAEGGVVKRSSASDPYANVYKNISEFKFTPATIDGGKIKFECNGNWISNDDYQVVVYIPTEGVSDNTCLPGQKLPLDQYKSNYVNPGYKINVKIANVVITVKWQTYQMYTPIGGGTPIRIDGPIEERDISLTDKLIEVQFYDITKIN